MHMYVFAGPRVPRGYALLLPGQRAEGRDQVHQGGLGCHHAGGHRDPHREVPAGHAHALRARVRALRDPRERR